ncbi:MAG: hypothetical protein LBU36_01205 [Clostridiales bacterium]|jgi:predicted transcriptional regulator|nr:hypothetical protein [Clostridiales bacterium]
MVEDVKNRLGTLGYTVSDADEWLLNFAIDKITWLIRNECNTAEIPEGLHFAAVDMVCGEVLFVKKRSGGLDGLEVPAAVKSIKEGDTAVTYAVSDDGVTLDGFISALKNSGAEQLARYRRFAW